MDMPVIAVIIFVYSLQKDFHFRILKLFEGNFNFKNFNFSKLYDHLVYSE